MNTKAQERDTLEKSRKTHTTYPESFENMNIHVSWINMGKKTPNGWRDSIQESSAIVVSVSSERDSDISIIHFDLFPAVATVDVRRKQIQEETLITNKDAAAISITEGDICLPGAVLRVVEPLSNRYTSNICLYIIDNLKDIMKDLFGLQIGSVLACAHADPGDGLPSINQMQQVGFDSAGDCYEKWMRKGY